MLGNLFRQKTGVVLRRRAGDWHMYVIGAFAGVIGGFYIWLEPLRQLQLEVRAGALPARAGQRR